MMHSLKMCGKFDGLSGLVVGQMSQMQDNETPFGSTAYQIIADVVKEYDFPVLFNFPAGHTRHNEPLLFGAKVKLSVSDVESTLTFSLPSN